jgi:hypothetical protein
MTAAPAPAAAPGPHAREAGTIDGAQQPRLVEAEEANVREVWREHAEEDEQQALHGRERAEALFEAGDAAVQDQDRHAVGAGLDHLDRRPAKPARCRGPGDTGACGDRDVAGLLHERNQAMVVGPLAALGGHSAIVAESRRPNQGREAACVKYSSGKCRMSWRAALTILPAKAYPGAADHTGTQNRETSTAYRDYSSSRVPGNVSIV